MLRRGAFVVILLLAAALALYAVRRPAESEPVPSFLSYLRGDRPAMVAFNPSAYAPGQSSARVTPLSEISADLKALRPAFDGLVLYAYEPQLTPAVVDVAVAEGYRAVLLGIWNPRSPAEVDGVADLIRRNAARIALAVCIGNEGINDNRYTIEDLKAAADRLRSVLPPEIHVPVTTSEPWSDYGWRALAAFGDFLAPNIHPVLDRPALPAADAAVWARRRAEVVARATRRPVLVKETGWPNGGAPNFTPPDQATFWRTWLQGKPLVKMDEPTVWASFAAAFEAFDAPWKASAMANAIEGRWGLLDPARQPYPAFHVWRERAER